MSEMESARDVKLLVMRHDVEKHPERAFRLAQMEHDRGIRTMCYFRAVPKSWNEEVIRNIAALGHEVGYHYDNNPSSTLESFRLGMAMGITTTKCEECGKTSINNCS